MQPPMDMRMGPQARAYMGGVGQNPYMMDQRMGVAGQPGMPPNSINVAGMPGPTFNGKPAPGYTPEGFQNPGMMYGMNTMHVNNGEASFNMQEFPSLGSGMVPGHGGVHGNLGSYQCQHRRIYNLNSM